MKAISITADILKTCHFPESAHGHGPGMFFSMHRCVEHPRFQVKDLSDRKARQTTRIYLVDGKEMPDLDAAIAALNVPVVLTAEEEEILATVPSEWTRAELGTRGDTVTRLFGLTCKGMVEWSAGSYRRRAQP